MVRLALILPCFLSRSRDAELLDPEFQQPLPAPLFHCFVDNLYFIQGLQRSYYTLSGFIVQLSEACAASFLLLPKQFCWPGVCVWGVMVGLIG